MRTPTRAARSCSASAPSRSRSARAFSGTGAAFPEEGAATVRAMDAETAIRTRRTHKACRPEPLPRETVDELLELARWAPNHHLTNPWRFHVIGPDTLAKLKEAAGPEAASKLDRAPTLVVVTTSRMGDPVQDEEDLLATGVAAYIVLLAAHARGLVGYWRTPAVLRTPEGRAAAGVPEREHAIGLLHLGPPRQEQPPPGREPVDAVVEFLA